MPQLWCPPSVTPTLSPDSSPRFVDQNTDRNPGTPLEALVLAVQKAQPDFDFTNLDVVTDRRPIRKLFGFVIGEPKSFQFGVSIIGNTALFTRMEERTRDELATQTFQGYREAFESAYTKTAKEAQGSTSHHRIVSYDFGGLKFLVRFAVDAFFEDRAQELMRADGTEPLDLGCLVKNLKATTLEDPAPPPSRWDYSLRSSVNIFNGGQKIPHAATLEMTTRSEWSRQKHNAQPLQQKLADLWISQTPNYIEAWHKDKFHKSYGLKPDGWRKQQIRKTDWRSSQAAPADGKPRTRAGLSFGREQSIEPEELSAKPPKRQAVFTELTTHDMAEKLLEWESSHADDLQKLVVALKKVIKAAKEFKGSCIVSYNSETPGSLQVSGTGEGRDLPTVTKYLRPLFLPKEDILEKEGDISCAIKPTAA